MMLNRCGCVLVSIWLAGAAVAQVERPETRPGDPATTQATQPQTRATSRAASRPVQQFVAALVTNDEAAREFLTEIRSPTLPPLPDLRKHQEAAEGLEKLAGVVEHRIGRLGQVSGLSGDLESVRAATIGGLEKLRDRLGYLVDRLRSYPRMQARRKELKQQQQQLRQSLAELEKRVAQAGSYDIESEESLDRLEAEAEQVDRDLRNDQARLEQLRQVFMARQQKREENRKRLQAKEEALAKAIETRSQALTAYRSSHRDTAADRIRLDCQIEQAHCEARWAQVDLAISRFSNDFIRRMTEEFEDQDRTYLEYRVRLLGQLQQAQRATLARGAVQRYKRLTASDNAYVNQAGRAGVALEEARALLAGRKAEFAALPEVSDLMGRSAAAEATRLEFMDNLERKSGAEVLRAYRDVRRTIDEYETLRDRWAARLAELETRYADVADEFRKHFREFTEAADAAARAADDMDVWTRDDLGRQFGIDPGRLETEMQELRDDMEGAHRQAAKTYHDGLAAMDGYLARLEEYRSRLYWRRLRAKEPMPIATHLRGLGGDVRTLAGDLRRIGRDPSWLAAPIRRSVAAVPWSGQLAGLLMLAAAVGGPLAIRRRLRELLEKRRTEIESAHTPQQLEAIGFTTRLQLHVLEIADRLMIPGLVLLALVVWRAGWAVSGPAPRIVVLLLTLWVALRLAGQVGESLFAIKKPRLRIINCSNRVAGYWNRRLGWQIALAAVCLTPLAVLRPLGEPLTPYLPHLAGLISEIYKAAALGLLLEFLLRRKYVLPVFARPAQVVRYHLLRLAHPVVWLGFLVLLALQLAGYGALVAYLFTGAVGSIGILAGAAVATRVIGDLRDRWVSQIRQQAGESDAAEEGDPAAGELGTRLLAGGLRIAAIVAAVYCIAAVWGLTLVELRAAAGRVVWSSGDQQVTLGRLFGGVVSIGLAVFISKGLRGFLSTQIYPQAGLEQSVQFTVNTMINYVLIGLGVYAALVVLRLDLSVFTVMLGTLGLGLGLGLQPLFINFVSGLMIMFERHVKVGDTIDVGGTVGTVTRITTRSTIVRTGDNIDIVLPNSSLITDRVTNWSLTDRRVRARLDVGVAYGSDPNRVMEILRAAAAAHPNVDRHPAPQVWFTNFGDNALAFSLLVWISDLGRQADTLTELRVDLARRFQEAGIDVPFPQRTVSFADRPLRVEVMARAESR